MKIEIRFDDLHEMVNIVIECKMSAELAKEFVNKCVLDMIDESLVVTIKNLPDGF